MQSSEKLAKQLEKQYGLQLDPVRHKALVQELELALFFESLHARLEGFANAQL